MERCNSTSNDPGPIRDEAVIQYADDWPTLLPSLPGGLSTGNQEYRVVILCSACRIESLAILRLRLCDTMMLDFPIDPRHFHFLRYNGWFHAILADIPHLLVAVAVLADQDATGCEEAGFVPVSAKMAAADAKAAAGPKAAAGHSKRADDPTTITPGLIREDGLAKLWHKTDRTFRRPKTNVCRRDANHVRLPLRR